MSLPTSDNITAETSIFVFTDNLTNTNLIEVGDLVWRRSNFDSNDLDTRFDTKINSINKEYNAITSKYGANLDALLPTSTVGTPASGKKYVHIAAQYSYNRSVKYGSININSILPQLTETTVVYLPFNRKNSDNTSFINEIFKQQLSAAVETPFFMGMSYQESTFYGTTYADRYPVLLTNATTTNLSYNISLPKGLYKLEGFATYEGGDVVKDCRAVIIQNTPYFYLSTDTTKLASDFKFNKVTPLYTTIASGLYNPDDVSRVTNFVRTHGTNGDNISIIDDYLYCDSPTDISLALLVFKLSTATDLDDFNFTVGLSSMKEDLYDDRSRDYAVPTHSLMVKYLGPDNYLNVPYTVTTAKARFPYELQYPLPNWGFNPVYNDYRKHSGLYMHRLSSHIVNRENFPALNAYPANTLPAKQRVISNFTL